MNEFVSNIEKKIKYYKFFKLILIILLISAIPLLAMRRTGAIIYFIVIVFFGLIGSHVLKKQYKQACMQAEVCTNASDFLGSYTYTASQSVSGNLTESLGFTPSIPVARDQRLFHVVHAEMNGCPFEIGETAFVRRDTGNLIAGGTVLTVKNCLPLQEDFVILQKDAFKGIVNLNEYNHAGWQIQSDLHPISRNNAICFSVQEQPSLLPLFCTGISEEMPEEVLAAASYNGSLSLFIQGRYYSDDPDKVIPVNAESIPHHDFPGRKLAERILQLIQEQNDKDQTV